jgi:pleiotropic regulator 1
MAPRGGDRGGPAVAASPASVSVRELCERSAKRTHSMFETASTSDRPPTHEPSVRLKMAVKIRDDFDAVRRGARGVVGVVAHGAMPQNAAAPNVAVPSAATPSAATPSEGASESFIPGLDAAASAKEKTSSDVAALIDAIDDDDRSKAKARTNVSVASGALAVSQGGDPSQSAGVHAAFKKRHETSAALIPRLASKWPRPKWHQPWKLYRVISGHMGWVRSVHVDPSNEWFVTGSADRTIKVWDLASGQLRLTLTGHIEQVTGLAVSDRHPYMFSCGLDKQVKCWDLEYNKVIRHYHGHLSGVYALALHPELDVLMTGGRDSACRVWDMRTKVQAMCLSGHDNTVGCIVSQRTNPQVMTGSYDSTVKLWDLAAGKCATTLTHHKKGVRALALHPREFSFLSASADNIKKFGMSSEGGGGAAFKHNMLTKQRTIVNALAVSEDDVVVSGGDDGSLWFWDYNSGHCFQQSQAKVQPGSMESEAGVFAATFDKTGTRLITVEADKTIKMWKQDEDASEETHPNLPFVPPKDMRRF